MTEAHITTTQLEGINDFCTADTRQSMIKDIDTIIEKITVNGLLRDYNIEAEMFTLFNIKRLMAHLPF